MIFLKTVSALEKCFLDDDFAAKAPYDAGSALRGDRLSYQICLYDDGAGSAGKTVCRAAVDSPAAAWVQLSRVCHVPSQMPVFPDRHDEHYLRTAPGLYPDLLLPLTDNPNIYAVPRQLHSLWVDVRIPEDAAPGVYPITVTLQSTDGAVVGESRFTLTVRETLLPPQKLLYTQWFHGDCLAGYYGVEVFSPEHWRIMENFLRTAADNGVNMILTPVFTPPLDTAVGHNRPTVQLADITVAQGRYTFDFARLGRWIDLCRSVGIHRFEMPHLFTQWGARHAPQIVATVDGERRQIFGWDSPAVGGDYTAFLRQFLPALRAYLREKGVEADCAFHISDEPNQQQLADYRSARDSVAALLEGCCVMDAQSDYEFYAAGVVQHPIVCIDMLQPFLDGGVEDLWAYTCCAQCVDVSNRFLAMPSARNRIIGVQLFRHRIRGFLQWGYNFYHNQYSIAPIDPYQVTDGEYFVPSGDAFSVYPAPDGTAWETIHLAVFTQALRDLRALEALAERRGRETVNDLIDRLAGKPVTFTDYPRSDEFLLQLRETVNELLG
ncbi:MAG: DUF4091 domain-containing protein [Oscillospiraceae bacterium]|nr:DUF4091 domain-containing protein [Oscillospiraceae bacterium]